MTMMRATFAVAPMNGSLSLTEARENYRRLGACNERSIGCVRPARPDEIPEAGA